MAGMRIDVRGLILEALVIVASILAAFTLDRWWDARQDGIEERLVLGAQEDEFLQARAELEERLGLHQRIAGSLRSTLNALQESRTRGQAFATVPDTALACAWVPPTTQLALGTLNGWLTSGRFGLLRNRELRNVLPGLDHMLGELY
ncbi:MAG: hypothetical protein L0271_06045 [Gemmatimonadetes bacterium]|nr:hypothetical protein [Gemmatimonadota bacterium]